MNHIMSQRHKSLLEKLALTTVHLGLGIRSGQELIITASVDALPLVRLVTRIAYQSGASSVTTFFSDDVLTLDRFAHAGKDAFDYSPSWLYNAMANALRSGAARLSIGGGNPLLLRDQDSDKVSRASRALSLAYRPILDLITSYETTWAVICSATPDWASLVFPELPLNEALNRLWEEIFIASRVDCPDPISEWRRHNSDLHKRTALLNEKHYSALRFRGPGTDLLLGLADDHLWLGGSKPSKNGTIFNPNIPTEEVFTMPHFQRVEGYVSSTKPLSYQGSLIRDIVIKFNSGCVIQALAGEGQAALDKLLSTDVGASRLGEVGLVPHSSPISLSGLLFYNTLFDENAASHIAFGQAYRTSIRRGTNMTDDELEKCGANKSSIHVDWMIGSKDVEVDGLFSDGNTDPLMRSGEWV